MRMHTAYRMSEKFNPLFQFHTLGPIQAHTLCTTLSIIANEPHKTTPPPHQQPPN